MKQDQTPSTQCLQLLPQCQPLAVAAREDASVRKKRHARVASNPLCTVRILIVHCHLLPSLTTTPGNCEKAQTENKTTGARCSCSTLTLNTTIGIQDSLVLTIIFQINDLRDSAPAPVQTPRIPVRLATPVHVASGHLVSIRL